VFGLTVNSTGPPPAKVGFAKTSRENALRKVNTDNFSFNIFNL